MKTNEIIDILIPAYNCEKYIEKCLKSLIAQTYKDINIIVANDGSTDNTSKILKKERRLAFINSFKDTPVKKTGLPTKAFIEK